MIPLRNLRSGASLVALAAALWACGSQRVDVAKSRTPYPMNTAAKTTGVITPQAGGTIAAPTGDTLVVPAGAVKQNVEVTLTPVALPAPPDADLLGAVKLEPEGLVFAQPAALTLSLTVLQQPFLALSGTQSSADLTLFGVSDEPFVVGPTGSTASGPIYGFSCHGAGKNCHSGTRDYLLKQWQGLADRDLAARAKQLGLPDKPLDSCEFPNDPLLALIEPYFEPCFNFDAGQPVTPEARQAISEMLANGRQVVFLFGNEFTAPADPSSTRWGNVKHSAVGVRKPDGTVQVHNQLNVTSPEKLVYFTPEAAQVDVPLAEVDVPGRGLRDMRDGEAFRLYIEDPPRPMTAEERAANVPVYSQMVVLCERCRSCNQSSLTVQITLDGRNVPFQATPKATNQGTYDGVAHLRDIVGFEAINGALGSPSAADLLMMFDRRQITGTGIYALAQPDVVFDKQAAQTSFVYAGPAFTNANDGTPVVFSSTGGSVTLMWFGTSIGAKVTGRFSATLSGDQTTGPDGQGGWLSRTITGTVTGDFDVTIE